MKSFSFVAVLLALAEPALAQEASVVIHDTAVCRASVTLNESLPKGLKDEEFGDSVANVSGRLGRLCAAQPTSVEIREGTRALWFAEVDALLADLDAAVAERLSRPVTAGDRKLLRFIAGQSARLQNEFNLERLSAYQAVRVETKEVPVEKVVVRQDDRAVGCRNAVQANVGEAEAFLATVLQENNPFVGFFEEASRGSDSQFGPIIRQTKRALLRERIEASLESLRTIRNSCSY